MVKPGGATDIWDRFSSEVISHGEKPAIIEIPSGKQITYNELKNSAVEFSDLLSEYQVGAVAIIGEPDLELTPLILTCALENKCFLPLNQDESRSRLLKTLDQLSLDVLILSRRKIKEFSSISKGNRTLGEHDVFVYLKISKAKKTTNNNLFLLTQSSGSTGEPKLIGFSQKTKIRRTDQSINLFHITADDVVLSASPMHHSMGQRHFFVALLSGATLVKAFPFNPKHWIRAVQDFAISFAIPVATHLKILNPHIEKDPGLLSRFRCLVTSSATADPELKSRLLQNTDFELWEIYGMTETACATAVRFTVDENLGHVGKPIEGTTVRIRHESADGRGEIEVLSDCLCDGYLNDQALWDNSLTPDGYFCSGDLGCFDEQRNLVFLGRTTESFESCGLLIFPVDIERVAAQFKGVRDCVAFPVQNEIFGNLIGLAILAETEIDRRKVLSHLRKELPKNKVPALLFIKTNFPLLASGKLDKKKLVKQIINENINR